jgi:two-component system, NarL family, nitrate/nitrite response regulator NarL
VPAVRVLVVGADPLARAGLKSVLAERADVALAGEASPGDAEEVAARTSAAAIVWDLGVAPGAGGAIRPAAERVPVVALAAADGAAADALRAGARAVLLRGAPADAIAAALVAVERGLAVLDPTLSREWVHVPEAAPGADALTAREREVLGLLGEGLANKAIAARLGISEHTAKFHVNAILAKLGVGSRAEAIVRAARLGLLVL